jgi:hypothetical protein
MRFSIFASFLLFLATSAYSQETVTFCDLVRNPEKYTGRVVTVRALYRVGFEWSELYCPECRNQRAWLEFPYDMDDLDKASQRVLKQKRREAEKRVAGGGISPK